MKRQGKMAIAHRMRTILILGILSATVAGCTRYVVRDTEVYQAELNQYDAWATKQASLLKGFVTDTCLCAGDEFTTAECREAADFILTVEARAPWHKAMSLFLAGINDERPHQDPPKIPASSTLCPGGM